MHSGTVGRRWGRSVVLIFVALGCHKDPGGPAPGNPEAPGYNIIVRFVRTPAPSHVSAVQDAVTLWQRVITGDVPALPINTTSGSCGPDIPGQNETVDDIVIWVKIQTIDGAGGVLGQGGPCTIRASSGLPAVGLMILDTADMTHSFMRRVIIHEMGHALGFGTTWTNRGLLTDEGGADPIFTGAEAISQFNAAGGGSYGGRKVPVENTGGPGTQDSHWRESVFGSELMTGFLNSTSDKLSAVTAGAMADLGYGVTITGAEVYVLPLAAAVMQAGSSIALGDDFLRLPLHVVP